MNIVMVAKNTQGCVYNRIRRSYLRTGSEQRFCPECDGSGEGDELLLPPNQYFGQSVCSKCKGRGTVDWIKKLR
jgi:DnaJ-class molecular chaperone